MLWSARPRGVWVGLRLTTPLVVKHTYHSATLLSCLLRKCAIQPGGCLIGTEMGETDLAEEAGEV